MGGRGAGSGLDPYKGRDGKWFRYGDEYKTLWQDGDVKYVTPRDDEDNIRVPQETRTPNRIYALVDRKGNVKSICHYGSDGKLDRQIDLDHYHNRKKPHVHDGFNHGEGRDPSESEKRESEKIIEHWKQHEEQK